MKDLSSFDVLSYLSSKGISYTESGKNVSKGWIGIQCPFPMCYDSSNHMGINLESKNISCWNCGERGSIIKLLKMLENGPIKPIIDEYSTKTLTESKARKFEGSLLQISLKEIIPFIDTELAPYAKAYLQHRRFNPFMLEKKYGVRSGGFIGDYKFRIIIPIIVNGKIVSFISRDIQKESKLRYKNCPIEESAIPVKSCLYNWDNIRKSDTIIVTEGVFDVWRIGDNTTSSFGTKYTIEQIGLLKAINPKRVFFLFDEGASHLAEEMAYQCNFINHIEIIYLDEGDPDNLSENDVKILRKQVFGKIY